MNTKQKMAYHAREYRRLKSLLVGDDSGKCQRAINGAGGALNIAFTECDKGNAKYAIALLEEANVFLRSAEISIQNARKVQGDAVRVLVSGRGRKEAREKACNLITAAIKSL